MSKGSALVSHNQLKLSKCKVKHKMQLSTLRQTHFKDLFHQLKLINRLSESNQTLGMKSATIVEQP